MASRFFSIAAYTCRLFFFLLLFGSTKVFGQGSSDPAVLDTVRAGRFDNGRMWTFEYPPVDYLRETYGFEADEAWFEKARLGALRIPGCSASFVSPNGLVMTNHHCARSIAARLSREGEDLLNDGFFARSLDEERPVDNFYADQLIAVADVTDEVAAALDAAQTDEQRQQARQSVFSAIQARLKAEAGGTDDIVVQIVPLYSGGRYSAYTFRRYHNLKLVFAPELRLGNFGGEWDNFSYPRYKLDATFFRVYDGDEPLKNEYYFRWSESGTVPGELVFVVGNPGSTNRLESVAQLEYRRDVSEKSLLAVLQGRLEALREEYEESPSPALKAQILSISNSEKLYRGRVAGLNDPILMARRADTERQFREAIAADPKLQSSWGDLLDRIAALQQEKRQYAAEAGAFSGFQLQSSLESATLRRAVLAQLFERQKARGATAEQLDAMKQQILSIENLPANRERWFLTARLEQIAAHLSDDPALSAVLSGRTPEAVAADILERSVFSDSTSIASAIDAVPSSDPAMALAGALVDRWTAYVSAMTAFQVQEAELLRERGRAQYDVFGADVPPDATFSLRIADGIIAGYPYNGTIAPPYVTFYGLYDHYHSYKGTPIADSWDLPERWLNAPPSFDRNLPLNLVSTNDIVGGNSGSPLLNKDLEIVGLVFDGNVESLPSAFIFSTDGSRTIAVDSRGILEAFDDVYDLDRLVVELTTGALAETEEEADAMR